MQVSNDLSSLACSFGTDRRTTALQDKASVRIAQDLIPDVFGMLADLKVQLPR